LINALTKLGFYVENYLSKLEEFKHYMLFNWKKLGITTLSIFTLLLTACSTGAESESENTLVDGKEIELVHTPWDDAIASTNVVGTVLEDLGFDVTLTSLDNAVMWQSVAEAEADALVSGWLPTTHGAQYEEYKEQLVHAGVNTENGQNGIAVPTYMENVNSIEDLNDQAGKTITGIEPGAGIMNLTQETVNAYPNLKDWELKSSSTGAMTTELGNAIENQEEIVITGWTPHWMFNEYDLKFLEDPKKTMGEVETINSFTRQGFKEENPIANSVIENFEWPVEELQTVMGNLNESGDPEEAAQNWIDNNQELVSEWTAEAKEMASSDSENQSSE